jgi:hypothetical protein
MSNGTTRPQRMIEKNHEKETIEMIETVRRGIQADKKQDEITITEMETIITITIGITKIIPIKMSHKKR